MRARHLVDSGTGTATESILSLPGLVAACVGTNVLDDLNRHSLMIGLCTEALIEDRCPWATAEWTNRIAAHSPILNRDTVLFLKSPHNAQMYTRAHRSVVP